MNETCGKSISATSTRLTKDEKPRLAYRVDRLDLTVLADQSFYMLFNEWYEIRATKYTGTVDEQRESELLAELQRLKATADRMADEKIVHTLQIRSVPVNDFGFFMRHYFVRVDELVEIHPGNEEKICLRGWMRNVDIGSDCLVATYRLCKSCADRAVRSLWSYSRKFSFAFRNCDHNCNDARQSLGIATTIFLILVALISLYVQQSVVPFSLITIGLSIGYASLSFSQSIVSPRLLGLLGTNPATVERNVGVRACDHACEMLDKKMAS